MLIEYDYAYAYEKRLSEQSHRLGGLSRRGW